MIGLGKNWARIVFLINCILELPFCAIVIIHILKTNLIIGLLNIVQLILQLMALIYLFRPPAANWFQPKKVEEPLPSNPADDYQDLLK